MQADLAEVHDAAKIFPEASDDELHQLARDVSQRGLIEPIELYEGKILDGRARGKACLLAGVQPRYTEADLNGYHPIEYVIKKNLPNHDLTPAQRAVLALEALAVYEEDARRRQMGNLRHVGEGRDVPPPPDGSKRDRRSNVRAAKLLGVGETAVANAKVIAKNAPELIEKIRSGELNISQAMRQAGYTTSTRPGSTAAVDTGKRDSLGRVITPNYGRGDKFAEATTPLRRYLLGWKRKGYEFRHINRKEAASRLKIIDELIAGLSAAREDIEQRSHPSTLRVKG